jgi:Abnormal spindle-like microcephaly-assoc'd, ASPM-SPD-2-Hydin
MRLPQSSRRPFFPTVLTGFLAVLGTMTPVGAHAATQELNFTPKFLSFGSVVVGKTETQVVVLTNPGSSSINISAIGLSSSRFSVSNVKLPVAVAAGHSLALSITFAPTEAGWTGEESVTFSDEASNPMARLVVAGNGVKRELLIATPLSLSFGPVPVGTRATRSVVLKNDNSENVTVKAFWPQSHGFFAKGPKLPVTVTPGQSIAVSITFSPQATGLDGSSIFVSGPNVDIPVTGTGTTTTNGQLSIAPGALSFGSVDVGATAKESLAMSASGGSVTVSSATSSNSQFTIPGSSFPLTIGAGQTVTLDVVFSPTQTGTASAKLTFASNASDPVTDALSGVGVEPQYSVMLSWTPSTSAVVGYNIYRGLTSGTYSRLNSTLTASTSYTDSTVTSGKTYYYAATAVNSSGQESGYSTPLKVVVP